MAPGVPSPWGGGADPKRDPPRTPYLRSRLPFVARGLRGEARSAATSPARGVVTAPPCPPPVVTGTYRVSRGARWPW